MGALCTFVRAVHPLDAGAIWLERQAIRGRRARALRLQPPARRLNPALPELADDEGQPVQFRRTLLNKCQEEFEAGQAAMKAVNEREKQGKGKDGGEEQVRSARREMGSAQGYRGSACNATPRHALLHRRMTRAARRRPRRARLQMTRSCSAMQVCARGRASGALQSTRWRHWC